MNASEKNWTDEQLSVIEHCGSHAIVTAVAGSGKTSTLVAHVLRQLERGQDPTRMLVLMFNRSAREDFQRKLTRSSHSNLTMPDIRTYHSMGLRLYQFFAKEGLLPRWTGDPLSGPRMDFECWKILQRVAPGGMQDSLKANKSSWVSELTGFIDLVKSTTRTPELVFEEYEYDNRKKLLLEGYHAFESWRLEQCLITYADMLYQPVMLMLRQPELVQRVTNKMDLMLVDEYQDTNEVQHTLLKIIAGRRAQVMVVGDPDQTIYEFRGARPEYILKTFAEDFTEPVHYSLSYTFRYGHRLALVADHLITRNQGRGDTLCIAHASTPPTQVERVEKNDHARWLAEHLTTLVANGRPLTDITVLVRLWSQAVTLELTLLETGIPFISEAEKGAFDRQEIQFLLYLLELAAGRYQAMPAEARYQRFWQLLRFPHVGIRDAWLKTFCRSFSEQEQNYGRWVMKQAEGYLPDISDFQKNRLLERGRMLLRVEQGQLSAAKILGRYIMGVELKPWILESALDRDRAEEQLLAMDSFIRYLASTQHDAKVACGFFDDLREKRQQNANKKKRTRENALLLTSMHKAKGLEWPVVILPGLIDRQLPCSVGDEPLGESGIEAERRLFYVAMTRAKEELYLVTTPNPDSRPTQAVDKIPSRFIGELRDKLSCQVGEFFHQNPKNNSDMPLDFPKSDVVESYAASVSPGLKFIWSDKAKAIHTELSLPWQKTEVNHSIFGSGKVLSETGTDFKVHFDDGSEYDFSKKSAHLYFV
ncbi:ATP-dependent helicase [Parendozoicomonas sp. Alg238-R29]|uniref:ATP-dependent helicase n=1 Tax=Parendozoicomonas sp. Alg238-R29 TaxID=2993446 RepID=UPI00248DFE61|nr:ATP-dependent helicase [Parendozoicomonas sp. Alg238-R29]